MDTIMKIWSYGKWAVLATCCFGLFYGGYITRKTTEKFLYNREWVVMNEANISVAMTQDNQLVVIDKLSGQYQVYPQSVAKNIFRIYVRQIETQGDSLRGK